MFRFENGDKAKSVITGFKGIITARADHLTGCNRYYLQPTINEDGTVPDGCWHDEQELKVIKSKKVKIEQTTEESLRGGFPSKIK